MVAMEPGMLLAQSIVPSNGSTAMSTRGPIRLPTVSPTNSMGASSRSLSPITIVPSIGSLLSSRRMASTAAWSAAFSSPRPQSRAADTAARSVTRTISSDRMRSSIWCGSTVTFLIGSVFLCSVPRCARSALLDPDQLRLLGQDTILLDRRQRPTYRILGGRIGDEHDRRRLVSPRRILAAVRLAVTAALHDGFKRNLFVRHAPRDGRRGAGPVQRGETDIVAALVT